MRRRVLIVAAAMLAALGGSLALAFNQGSSATDDSSAITRTWGLEVIANISPSAIRTSQTLNLRVAIRNLRPVPVVLKEPNCAAILPVIWDAKRRLVWQSGGMCPLMEPWPPKVTINPGQTTTSTVCFGVVRESQQCGAIPFRILQPGTYIIGGAAYDRALPELRFRIVRDDLFDGFVPGDVITPVDGEFVRTANVDNNLVAITRIQDLRRSDSDVMVLQVELKNNGASTIQLPVSTCDYPLAVALHDDAFEMPNRYPRLADNIFHDVCDTRFRKTTEAVAAGQSITTRMCFEARDHQAPWLLCIGLYERSIERIGVRIYGYDLPEFDLSVNR